MLLPNQLPNMRIWNIIIINICILTHILVHSSQSTWLVRKWKQSEPCQVFRVSYSGLDSGFILMPMQTSNSSLSSVYLLMTVLCFLIDLRWWIPSRCYGFTCWSWRRWMTCVKISAAATSPASRPRWTARRCSAASQEAPTPQHRHRYTRKHPRNLSLSNNRSAHVLLTAAELVLWSHDESPRYCGASVGFTTRQCYCHSCKPHTGGDRFVDCFTPAFWFGFLPRSLISSYIDRVSVCV